MQASSIPAKFPIPFAAFAGGAYIRPIPQASQISIQNGAASLTDGFPPNTFIPPAAGGTGPFGQDYNGILNQITAWNQWVQAGAPVGYDATFQSAIGGYPKGAIIASATFGNWWYSTVDNNLTNPDTGGAGWQSLNSTVRPTRTALSSGTGVYTTPNLCVRLVGRMIGGGGGGGGTGSSTVAAGNGGQSSFGTIIALGGSAGTGAGSPNGGPGGAGGTGGTGSGTITTRFPGGKGGSGNGGTSLAGAPGVTGSEGGNSPFGGAGQGGIVAVTTPSNAVANSGSGGGGGGAGSASGFGGGGGGGVGEYVEFTINAPTATYSWVIGAAGTAGTGSTQNGSMGGSGVIILDEYYA